MTALAFDVYGTLIDTAGVTGHLKQLIGDRAVEFSNQWRSKQLEYTWRYGLMGVYRNFPICTSQALDWTCAHMVCELNQSDKDALLAGYLELPAFDDVLDGLEQLKSLGVAMYAFSNGVPDDLESLLKHAHVFDLLDGIVSVDDKQTFKPNPLLYHYFMEVASSKPEDSWLVSSNGFDVCGAVAAEMKAFLLRRNPAVTFDFWEFQPTHVVSRFDDIVKLLD